MREVLLLGLRRAGKTSISRVVFGNMDPSQTQYLHATYAVTPTQVSVDALAKFTILDFPGQEDMVAKDIIGMQGQMRDCGALVFVLDCTDYSPSTGGGKRADYEEAIDRLVLVVEQMHIVTKPDETRIVDVFLHKADKLTSEHQRGVQEEVRQQLQFRLKGRIPAEFESRRVVVQYHLTSIFDHSVFYAFSLVARRVIPNILHIQSLLQVCCNNSHVLSYFLFGISRRMFIASANASDDRRASEREVLEYECCSDIVDMFQSMHSFVGDNNRKLAIESSANNNNKRGDGESKGKGKGGAGNTDNVGDQNDGSNKEGSNNNATSETNNNNNVAGGSHQQENSGVSPNSSPSTATTFPHVNNAVVGNNNNNNTNSSSNSNNNTADENNNKNQPTQIVSNHTAVSSSASENPATNNTSSTSKQQENNNAATAAGENIVHDTASKVIHHHQQKRLDIGSLVDTTQSAVFNFPSARTQDCIKPVYLVRTVGPLLTLVVGIKNENVDSMRSATEYNIDLLERALMQILNLNEEILRNSQ